MFQNKNSLKILFIILAALCFSPVVSPPIALFLGIIFVNIFGQVFNADKIIKIVLQVSIVGLVLELILNKHYKQVQKVFYSPFSALH